MFTGLVTDIGSVLAIEPTGDGARLQVGAGLASEIGPGDSVAVSGVCLTAVEASRDAFRVDVVAETLGRSSLAALAEGDRVNLELPLRAADRLGGHIVQGHVDGVGTVLSVAEEGLGRMVRVGAPGWCGYVVDKGSVTLDGVSLTAIAPDDDSFSVALIPETLERTTLGALERGRRVNVEVDVIAKYVERLGAVQQVDRLAGRVSAEPAGGTT